MFLVARSLLKKQSQDCDKTVLHLKKLPPGFQNLQSTQTLTNSHITISYHQITPYSITPDAIRSITPSFHQKTPIFPVFHWEQNEQDRLQRVLIITTRCLASEICTTHTHTHSHTHTHTHTLTNVCHRQSLNRQLCSHPGKKNSEGKTSVL